MTIHASGDGDAPAARLADLVGAREPRCGQVRLVCIDGPAGAGKTTLAGRLSDLLGAAPVVHLDDVYEGWGQDIGDPLAARIEAWLAVPWASGIEGRFPRFDWQLGRYVEWVSVPAAPVVVVEGCGSASRRIRRWASLVVWVEAPAAARLSRGLTRDGSAMAEHWQRWQASEARHFAADGTRDAADVVIGT